MEAIVENTIEIPFLSQREMVFFTSNPNGQVHITLIQGTFHTDYTSYCLASSGFFLLSHLHLKKKKNVCSSEQHLLGIKKKNICAISDTALLWLGPVDPFPFILHSKTTAFLLLFSQREGFGRRVITAVVAPNPQFCFPQFLLPKSTVVQKY